MQIVGRDGSDNACLPVCTDTECRPSLLLCDEVEVRQERSGFQLTAFSDLIGVWAVVCVDALPHPLTMGQRLHVSVGVEAGPDAAGDYTHRCAEPCDVEVVGKRRVLLDLLGHEFRIDDDEAT